MQTEDLLREIDALIRRSNAIRSNAKSLCIARSDHVSKPKAVSLGK
jgi:hypothetical protein